MKLIMENWRVFSEGKAGVAALAAKDEDFHQWLQNQNLFETLNEDEDEVVFRGLLTGGLLALIPLFYSMYVHQENKAEAAQVMMKAGKAEGAKSAKKIADLDKQVNNNGAAWYWSDDPGESREQFPSIDWDSDKTPDASVLPPTWSITHQVLQDKKNGIINVPGYSEGEVPPAEVIINVLKGDWSPTDMKKAQLSYVEDYRGYLMNTEEMGEGTLSGISGVYPSYTVAVNPQAFKPGSPLADTGRTATETYIKVYFDERYLGTEDAMRLGIKLSNQGEQ
jgi:hypothetical protein